MFKFPYREEVGALMSVAAITQVDIASAVRAVTRFCENPELAHKKAALKVMQYLLRTKEWVIDIDTYTGSDFGALLDTIRSVSGAVVMLAKGAISWHSRMQAVTTSGTLEAEYIALSEAVKEVPFLRQVQDFMEPTMRIGAVNVFEHNEGAIKLAVNKHASRRTKHIDVKYHLVRDAGDTGKAKVVAVVVDDSHIQRTVLAAEETTATQQLSRRPIKCQSRLWSQRGTKANGSHHGDSPLLRPTGMPLLVVGYSLSVAHVWLAPGSQHY